MAQTAQTNRKKIMVPATMSKSGWRVIEARDDVEGVEFVPTIAKAEFHKVLEEASGICLGVQPFSDPELDAATLLDAASRTAAPPAPPPTAPPRVGWAPLGLRPAAAGWGFS